MIINLKYLIQFPNNVYKFQVDSFGDMYREIPDLLKIRIYKKGKLIYTSSDKELPMKNDILEYDIINKNWYIVKECTI